MFWLGNLTERELLEDSGVHERVILKWIFKKSFGGVYWIHAAQQTDRSPTPVMDICSSEMLAPTYQNTLRLLILRTSPVFSANFVNN